MEIGITNTKNTRINYKTTPEESKVSDIKSIIPSSGNTTPELQIQKTPLQEYNVSEADSVVEQSQEVDKTADVEEKVNNILNTHFYGRPFHFAIFAKVNDIDFNPAYKPHSDIVKHSFDRMHSVCLDLLAEGITVYKGENGTVTIKFTAEEIIDAYNRVANSDNFTAAQKAYKLYSELGNIISEKLFVVAKDNYFTFSQKELGMCLLDSYNLCKSILSLPLVNFTDGMKMCTNMLQITLVGPFRNFKLSEPELLLDPTASTDRQKLINGFKALGINFSFSDNTLANQLLDAAKFATSIGMKTPLFMAEITAKESIYGGFSNDLIGIAIRDTALPQEYKGFLYSHHTFYHENTHHARSAAGTFHADKTIANKTLNELLGHHHKIIPTIQSQIRDYALTDYEEYIADFSALVLCCLEQNRNPFDYITDQRLWRLYYEFGGPDYVNAMIEKGFINDTILSDKSDKWLLSGYPSKFGIDIRKIENQQVAVEGMVAVGVKTSVAINEKIILPPPPLGYCYTTENDALQLKVNKKILPNCTDDKCYYPTFCSLTNGPLSLMYAEDRSIPDHPRRLQHHFELL